MNIIRKMKLNKYVYVINDIEVGEANYTYGFLPRIIKVSNKCNEIVVKQTNWLLNIFNSFPILNLEKIVPFKYYRNGVYCGRSKKILLKPVFEFFIKSSKFELVQHNNNYISLTRDNIQIALYKKSDFTLSEENSYNIYYDKNNCIDIQNLIVFLYIY